MSVDRQVPTKPQASSYLKWVWWLLIVTGAVQIVNAIASRESSKSRTLTIVLNAILIVCASWSLLIIRKRRMK